ncbi:PP2C family protein-serine/threonine phosphatase [Pseudonocardia xinjiangensis]|uniref:Serine/threonine-protein phosphatase n=1 Tax=Pseudonocardia xinjiangensis TaxID=75289 RepID=A0ABX1RKP5_9PSEU|nr:protein phosphatase 2C domain-containing protein [Pseudonocardia xinjiangensis]NMH80952.1 serine/threonine-protein phosphatase [Pseudonocardia xinjiangensis]
MSPTLRSAAGSDVGRRRSMNQDSAAISPRLLAVADGMGGHAHGEVASSVAVSALLDLDARLRGMDLDEVDLLAALDEAIADAAARLTELSEHNPELRGTGTTVVAFLVHGTRIGVAHIGDSRAYLLRDGELHRLTRDHTLVQSLLDEGRISPEEAATHPRRSWLIRTLQEGTPAEPDLFPVDGLIGDRYLVCSDGVTAVLADSQLKEVLAEIEEPVDVVARLIELANEGGGPDNITCVVADLVDETPQPDDAPVVVGAAHSHDA